MAQSTEPDFCKSQENWHQIQTRPLSSATLSRKSYAIPNTKHFAEKKNNQIALTISSSAADYYSLYRSLPGFCSLWRAVFANTTALNMWQCIFCLLKAIIHLLRTTGIFKDQSQHLVVEILQEHGVMIQQEELLPRKVYRCRTT